MMMNMITWKESKVHVRKHLPLTWSEISKSAVTPMELNPELYQWLSAYEIVKQPQNMVGKHRGGAGKNASRSRLDERTTSLLHSGVGVGWLVSALLRKQGHTQFTATIDSLKDSDTSVTKLYNWGEIGKALQVLGVPFDQDTKTLLVAGDEAVLIDLLDQIKEHDTPSAGVERKKSNSSMRLKNNRPTPVEVGSPARPVNGNGQSHGNRPYSPAEEDDVTGSDYERLLKENAKTPLDFLVLTLAHALNVDGQRALDLLTSQPRILEKIITQGIHGSCEGAVTWFQELFGKVRPFVTVCKSEPTSIPFVLTCWRAGFLSRDTNVVLWTARLYARMAYELSAAKMSGKAFEWFVSATSPPGGLHAVIGCFRAHPHLKSNLFPVIDHFSLGNFKSLFATHLPQLLPSPIAYLAFVHEFLPCFSENVESRTAIAEAGVVSFLLDYCLDYADPSVSLGERAQALALLTDLWIEYPAEIESIDEGSHRLINAMKKGCKDNAWELQIVAHMALFDLMESFTATRNPFAPFIYKTLIFSFIENHPQESMRHFIASNLCLILEAHPTVPVGNLVEPLVKQISLHGYDNLDFDLFVVLARHQRLGPHQALLLLDLLGKIALSDALHGRLASIPLLVLLSRFHSEPMVIDYVEQYITLAMSLYLAAEKKNAKADKADKDKEKSGSDASASMTPAQIRLTLILEVLAKVINLRHVDLNRIVHPQLNKMQESCQAIFGKRNAGISTLQIYLDDIEAEAGASGMEGDSEGGEGDEVEDDEEEEEAALFGASSHSGKQKQMHRDEKGGVVLGELPLEGSKNPYFQRDIDPTQVAYAEDVPPAAGEGDYDGDDYPEEHYDLEEEEGEGEGYTNGGRGTHRQRGVGGGGGAHRRAPHPKNQQSKKKPMTEAQKEQMLILREKRELDIMRIRQEREEKAAQAREKEAARRARSARIRQGIRRRWEKEVAEKRRAAAADEDRGHEADGEHSPTVDGTHQPLPLTEEEANLKAQLDAQLAKGDTVNVPEGWEIVTTPPTTTQKQKQKKPQTRKQKQKQKVIKTVKQSVDLWGYYPTDEDYVEDKKAVQLADDQQEVAAVLQEVLKQSTGGESILEIMGQKEVDVQEEVEVEVEVEVEEEEEEEEEKVEEEVKEKREVQKKRGVVVAAPTSRSKPPSKAAKDKTNPKEKEKEKEKVRHKSPPKKLSAETQKRLAAGLTDRGLSSELASERNPFKRQSIIFCLSLVNFLVTDVQTGRAQAAMAAKKEQRHNRLKRNKQRQAAKARATKLAQAESQAKEATAAQQAQDKEGSLLPLWKQKQLEEKKRKEAAEMESKEKREEEKKRREKRQAELKERLAVLKAEKERKEAEAAESKQKAAAEKAAALKAKRAAEKAEREAKAKAVEEYRQKVQADKERAEQEAKEKAEAERLARRKQIAAFKREQSKRVEGNRGDSSSVSPAVKRGTSRRPSPAKTPRRNDSTRTTSPKKKNITSTPSKQGEKNTNKEEEKSSENNNEEEATTTTTTKKEEESAAKSSDETKGETATESAPAAPAEAPAEGEGSDTPQPATAEGDTTPANEEAAKEAEAEKEPEKEKEKEPVPPEMEVKEGEEAYFPPEGETTTETAPTEA
jgi:hypothetical protein